MFESVAPKPQYEVVSLSEKGRAVLATFDTLDLAVGFCAGLTFYENRKDRLEIQETRNPFSWVMSDEGQPSALLKRIIG